MSIIKFKNKYYDTNLSPVSIINLDSKKQKMEHLRFIRKFENNQYMLIILNGRVVLGIHKKSGLRVKFRRDSLNRYYNEYWSSFVHDRIRFNTYHRHRGNMLKLWKELRSAEHL